MQDKPYILIVEDDKPIRNFIAAALASQGYKYIETDKGKEAVALSIANNPDIIILDLGLPDMDGIEAVKKIKEYDPNCKIIIISAMGQDAMVKEALTAGAVNFLVKPLKMETIVETLKRVMDF